MTNPANLPAGEATAEVAELRDEVEQVIRAWHAHEAGRGGEAVIDYDCAPTDQPATPAAGRLDVYDQFTQLSHRAAGLGDQAADVSDVIRAHHAYLAAVLGHSTPLDQYVYETQAVVPADGPRITLTTSATRPSRPSVTWASLGERT